MKISQGLLGHSGEMHRLPGSPHLMDDGSRLCEGVDDHPGCPREFRGCWNRYFANKGAQRESTIVCTLINEIDVHCRVLLLKNSKLYRDRYEIPIHPSIPSKTKMRSIHDGPPAIHRQFLCRTRVTNHDLSPFSLLCPSPHSRVKWREGVVRRVSQVTK